MADPIPPIVEHYRPNVAIILLNEDDEILICERFDVDGVWQFPQGGVDKEESVLSALHREVREEIGLDPEDYIILDQRGGYRYKYPPGVKEKKKKKYNCVGQEQTYFLCRLNSSQKKIDVEQDPPEFQDHKWIKPKKFRLKWLTDFKHNVYRQVFKDFLNCEIY